VPPAEYLPPKVRVSRWRIVGVKLRLARISRIGRRYRAPAGCSRRGARVPAWRRRLKSTARAFPGRTCGG